MIKTIAGTVSTFEMTGLGEEVKQKMAQSIAPLRGEVRRASGLEQEGDEALGAAHVLPIRLAEGGDKRGFLNGDAVGVGNAHAGEDGEKAGPISEGETESDQGNESPGVRRMADVAIRAYFDDGLAGMYGYFIGEKPTQKRHGVEAKSNPREHEADADEEDRLPIPQDGGLREEKGEREAQSERDPKKDREELKRTSIASSATVARTLGFRSNGLQHQPQNIGGPENDGVGGTAGKRQRVQATSS
jgi:hypothetical protein